MARLENPKREDLAPDMRESWDRVWQSRGGTVQGPQSVLMHVPPLAVRVADLGDYLRFHGLLAGADRELAILTTAREVDGRYEWQAHEPLARGEGVRSDVIESVRAKGTTDGMTSRERIIVEVVRSLYRAHRIPDDLYQRAVSELGREHLVELTALAGQYGLLACILNGFEVDLPAGAGPTF